MSTPSEPGEPRIQQRDAQADSLARNHPLLRSSICLECAAHRTIVSGKGSVFMLCQSDQAPNTWPKYPRQPVSRCPYFQKPEPPGQDTDPAASESA
ncbi:MAG: hypothetical protein ACK6DC_22140 [Planctomycetota bacterium]